MSLIRHSSAIRRFFIFSLCLLLILPVFVSCGKEKPDTLAHAAMDVNTAAAPLRAIIDPSSEVRGVYIATVNNIDYPSKPNLPRAALEAEIDDILDNTAAAGLNAVFFQVRPSADALYNSAIFPVSESLTTNGTLTFDPLAYLVDEAHQRNILVHAWINPLRITLGTQNRPLTNPDLLPDGSPAKEHPEWTVAYADGRLYFDPALPEVRQLIADGVREVVENYNVDGVIFDDYFYPYPVTDANGITQGFNDAASYAKYGNGMSLGDWRRSNINQMVELVYKTVKSISGDVLFGIAPFGIWQNDDGTNGGSSTRGLESYKTIYCDPLAWAQGGYIDYIAPQIYWRFSTSVAPFDELVRWWNRALDGTGVHLLISHGAYNYEDWLSPTGEMKKQIEYARDKITYRGSIFYGYDEIRKNLYKITDELTDVYDVSVIYVDPSPNGMGVCITSLPNGSYINEASVYLYGFSSPDKPLRVNGKTVERTRGGYFALHVYLKDGENVFRFEQEDETYVYTVYRGTQP